MDHEFSYLLDAWVLTGREAPGISWDRGGEPSGRAAEDNALLKCEMARLFQWPERLQWFLAYGGMTKWLCEDMRRGHFLWWQTQDGISLRRAKQIWDKNRKRAQENKNGTRIDFQLPANTMARVE